MKAPRLTAVPTGYDLLIENGKIPWAEDGTQAAQHAMVRLLVFKSEPSLDGKLTTKTFEGTKFYELIFNMEITQAEKELEIKSRILGTPGIERIISFLWEQSGHTVTITGKVKTIWGEETLEGTVELL
jgi:hypothetical protein